MGQTDRQTDAWITALLMAPYRIGRDIITVRRNLLCQCVSHEDWSWCSL